MSSFNENVTDCKSALSGLGVYKVFWDETDLYDEHSDDEISFFNIKLYKKIRGPLEYFGFREIKNDTVKKIISIRYHSDL